MICRVEFENGLCVVILDKYLKFSHFGAYGQNKYHDRLGWSRLKSPEQVGTFC